MKIFEHKVLIQASPERIFELYRDVEGWKNWDPEVETSSLNGSFAAESTGKLKPLKAPASRIKITQVKENQSFTVESKMPLCLLRFEHELSTESNGETLAIHRVTFSGPLYSIFASIIGKQIDAGLPKTMRGLKAKAEQSA